jgi:hypothetical protein
VAAGVVGLLVASGLIGRGQEGPPPREIVSRSEPTRALFTPDDCAQCHSGGASRAPALFGPRDRPQLVRLDELRTWDQRDKHRRAYDALTTPRGRAIGKALALVDVTRARACLSCHSTGFLPADPPAEVSGAFEVRAQGVGCTACHGPYLEWVQEHGLSGDRVRAWRQRSAEEKGRAYGMADLRDSATRAKVCASCHVGDPDERKVVTHAMYVAGHPPLPGFEASAFVEAMPPHWWERDEVPLFRADPALRERYHASASEPARTKAVLIGGVIALRESMRLLAAEAGGEARAEAQVSAWPDCARLECYSCHHDLESPGYRHWRQLRGFGHRFEDLKLKGTPGHPQPRPWPLALLRPALVQLERGTEPQPIRDALRESLAELYRSLAARPTGDPEEVARAAHRLEAAAQALLDALTASRFDNTTPLRLLSALAAIPDDEFPDYDSARQVAWAARSMYADCRPRPANDDRIAAVIRDLDRLLKLDLHAGRAAWEKLSAAKDRPDELLIGDLFRLSEAEYEASASKAAGYDPVEFKKVMARLKSLLSEGEPLPLPLPR